VISSGLSALPLIGSGLWRLLGSTEKPTGYHLSNHAFYTLVSATGRECC